MNVYTNWPYVQTHQRIIAYRVKYQITIKSPVPVCRDIWFHVCNSISIYMYIY